MREMKDSGIFDGVEIPATWDIMKFGKVCSIVTDFVASGSFADLRENVPYLSEPDYAMLVRTTDLAKTARSEGKVYISKASYEFLSNSNLFGGEIVLPNIGSIGDVYVVPKLYERMSLAPNSIMFKTRYCDKYYYYYFLCKVGGLQLSEISQSTAMAKFNKTDLKQIRVFLPSLAEQQRIAEFLDRKCAEVDEMIGLQEQIIEELKAYKQSVITEAVTKGLNPDAPMRDSGIKWIKQIPCHWDIVTPKALFSQRKEKAKEGQKQLTSSQQYGILYQDEYSEITGNKVVVVIKDFDILKQVQAGDFVISMRSFQGGLEYSTKTGSISSAYVMLIPNLDYVYPRFYRWLFKSICYINALQSTSNMVRDGQAMRFSNFAQVPLYQVPLKEQESIADYLDEKCADIDSLIQTKLSKIDSLKEYKKSIIYEYVTGKREVDFQ